MNHAEEVKQRRDKWNAAATQLEIAACEFARVTVANFQRAGPRAFQIFDKAYCAGLIQLKVEAMLTPSGEIAKLRLIATSRDGRRTELA